MLKISKLLTLLVAISCTYASDNKNDKQKIFQIIKVDKNLINNTQNIINNNVINENQDDVKEKKKTPEYIKDFCFSQNNLDLMEEYLLNTVPQSEVNVLKNKELRNKTMNIIEFVNNLIKREIVCTKKYVYDKFFKKTYQYGKWIEISNLDELNNNCINTIKNIIRHSFTENKPLLSNAAELHEIDGKAITEEINNIISNVQKRIKQVIKLVAEIKENDIEKIITTKIFPNDLKKASLLKKYQISNIISCLSKNISDNELFNEYISVLRNVLIQYSLCYSHFEGTKYIKNNKIVLANEHFSPFLVNNSRRGIAYNTLYNIGNNNEDKVKININDNLVTLDKEKSLIPAENSKLYYVFFNKKNKKNRYKYMSLDQDDDLNMLKQIKNKKTLLYITYLLHYISSKICVYSGNPNIVYEKLINNSIFNTNNNINDKDKCILKLVIDEIETIIKNNDGKIDNKKKEEVYYAILHSRANNILNENGEIIKISGNGQQITGLVDIFDNEVKQNINNNNVINNKSNVIEQNNKDKLYINIPVNNSNNSKQNNKNELDINTLIDNSNNIELDANEQNNNNKLTKKKRNRENNRKLNNKDFQKAIKNDSKDIVKNNSKTAQDIEIKQNTNNILLNESEYNTKLNNNKNNIKLIRPIFTDEQNNVLENRVSNINSNNNGELQTSIKNQINNSNNLQLIHLFIPQNTQLNNNILLSNNDNNLYHHYTISDRQFSNLLKNDQNNNNNTLRIPYFSQNSQFFNFLQNKNNQMYKK